MSKKKIAFITLAVGNYNTNFFNELSKQTKAWAEIYIIYHSNYKDFIPKELSKDIKLIPAKGLNIFNNKISKSIIKSPDSIIGYFFYYKNLGKILSKIAPDIIQTYLYFMPYSWQAAKYCNKNNIPLLLYEEIQREPYFIVTKLLNRAGLLWLRKYILNKVKYIISATKRGTDFQRKYLTKEDKVRHIPWPIDEEKVINLKRPKNKYQTLRLIVVARMVPYKDYETVISAMAHLKKDNFPFHLTIIGSGPLENEIKKSIKNSNLDSDITIYEKIPSEKMKYYYLNSDMLILASMNESYGMVVPESMACGCGIIISDTCGAKFFVENEKNGYIFETHNVEDLVDKLKMSKGKTERFGKYSRQLIKNKYSKRKITEKFVELLKQAINKGD